MIEFDEAFDPLRLPGIRYVGGVGQNANPKVFFVGEAPGPMENAKALPFVGGAGKVLKDLLTRNKFNSDEIYVTNVLKYMPCKPDSLNFRKPTQEEIDVSSPYLFKEIKIINPDVVCLLGNVPIRALFENQTSVGRLRGRFFNDDKVPEIFVTYHPSTVQYDDTGQKLKILRRDFAELSKRVHN